jgi:hypothetical protein
MSEPTKKRGDWHWSLFSWSLFGLNKKINSVLHPPTERRSPPSKGEFILGKQFLKKRKIIEYENSPLEGGVLTGVAVGRGMS